jgi:hypothetical protein
MKINPIRTHFCLTSIILCKAFAALGADLNTNQLMIGDTVVDGKMVDGKFIGEKVISTGSNSLALVVTTVSPIQESSEAWEKNPDSGVMSLRLLLNPGNGETQFGQAGGLHGHIYVAGARGWKTPDLDQTNRIDILTGGKNIVVMVLDNGPIYSSTNSGMTWRIFNTPGKYEFPLTIGPKGGGFIAAATLYSSTKDQIATNFPSNWYAIGSARNGSKLMITGDASQPAPALTIKQSNGCVVVSWPAEFKSFVLQENSDLASTNWVDVTNSINTVVNDNQVVLPHPVGNDFYRLRPQ